VKHLQSLQHLFLRAPRFPYCNWDVTRAQPGAAGILVDYTGGQVADTFETGTPEEHAAEFSPKLSRCCLGWAPTGMVLPQWIGGRVILTLTAATATGRSGNTPVLPASNESHKATFISAVNTLPSTLRVIWKARWKRASELRIRSSRLCAKSYNRRAHKAHRVRRVTGHSSLVASLSSCHLLQVLGISSSLHFDL
jgi:hypothetical protein